MAAAQRNVATQSAGREPSMDRITIDFQPFSPPQAGDLVVFVGAR
jgi:hypothetical protein